MLFDPKWDKKPSLEGLIVWLETQDPAKEYDFQNVNGRCLLGQYCNAIGMSWTSDGYSPGRMWWRDNSSGTPWIPNVSAASPHTFGAALERAKKELTRCLD